MRIGIRVWSVKDDTQLIDLILTYRWWVPGNDPWRLEAKTQLLYAQSGEWYEIYSYHKDWKRMMTLLGYQPGSRDYYGNEQQTLMSLTQVPNWPPSNFGVGDGGPANVFGFGPQSLSMQDNKWKIRWIG